MLGERGINVHKSTIWRWVQKYSVEMRKKVRKYVKRTTRRYHVDETPIKVKGKLKYLYRAIDSDGQTIDFFLTAKKVAFCSTFLY